MDKAFDGGKIKILEVGRDRLEAGGGRFFADDVHQGAPRKSPGESHPKALLMVLELGFVNGFFPNPSLLVTFKNRA